MTSRTNFVAWVVLALALVIAAWANHFGNGFHFDDSHAVVDNPSIRSLSSIPRFFADGRTFSTLPLNQAWRPVVSTSLAIDYWLGGGLRPLWFHVSTFACYLLMLASMYWLFLQLMEKTRPDPRNPLVALYGTTLFAVHPAAAETVNYVIQRADLYVAWSLVLSVAMFARGGRMRGGGLYLVPFVIGAMAKPTALVLPLLLALYVWIYERPSRRALAIALLPSLAVTVALALLHAWMTPPTYITGAAAKAPYIWTQPLVALHFVRTFFVPTQLSADTDWGVLPYPFTPAGLAGIVFVVLVVVMVVWRAARPDGRPVAFGLGWFILTMLPTSLTPLAEVTNDHRMFAPFVGLALAVSWEGFLILERLQGGMSRRMLQGLALVILVVFAWGTHVRNQVWATEETLWADVVQKSPGNGRGWMNYGLSLMRRGDYNGALRCFERGLELNPSYSYLYTNMGVVQGALGRTEAARQAFERGLETYPRTAPPCLFYARWLMKRGEYGRAVAVLEEGWRRSPDDPECGPLLVEALLRTRQWGRLEKLLVEKRRVPGSLDEDTIARFEAALQSERKAAIDKAEQDASERRAPETLLELSFVRFLAGQYEASIKAAREALQLRPRYAEAYNNIAACSMELERWDDAIKASQEALAIRPDLVIAANNLAYARQKKEAARRTGQ